MAEYYKAFEREIG